jgi:hypothetical protein
VRSIWVQTFVYSISRALDGTPQPTLGDRLTQPSIVTVGRGCTFVLRRHNHFSLLNPSPSA